MSQTLKQIVASGAFPGAYLFHIAGFPWAATNSEALRNLLVASSDLRKQITGDNGSEDDLQILLILASDVGSQSVEYGEGESLSVGPWSVRLTTDQDGFQFSNIQTEHGWGMGAWGDGAWG